MSKGGLDQDKLKSAPHTKIAHAGNETCRCVAGEWFVPRCSASNNSNEKGKGGGGETWQHYGR